MKKVLSLLLVIAMLFIVSACASGGNNDTTTSGTSGNDGKDTTTSEEPSVTEDPTPTNVKDTLGEHNFNNAVYTILSRKNTASEVKSTEVTGDLVKDAVYTRNAAVEDRFGVKIKVVEQPGDWGDRETFIATVQTAFLSGGHDYDLIMTHSAYIANIAINGLAYDMATLSDMDFSKKWWCESYTQNANIDGSIYTAIGDLTYSLYERMQCMYFNKDIVADNNIPDLYQLVLDGKWTFDKLKEFSLQVGSDLDGNGTFDSNDLYGLAMNNHTCRILATVFETNMTVAGENGHRTLNMPNEKFVDVYNALYSLIHENQQVRWDAEADSQVKLFTDNKVMLFAGRLGNAASMKDMTSEYGIIPFPKWNEDQANYISSARDYMTGIAIFGNTADPEMTGIVTEAMSMYGYQYITPAYYETTLKLKYLSDETAMGMLDLIRDTLTMDFAMTYTNSLDLIYSTMGDKINNKVQNIAAVIKVSSKLWTKDIDLLYENFAKLK